MHTSTPHITLHIQYMHNLYIHTKYTHTSQPLIQYNPHIGRDVNNNEIHTV